MKLETIIKKYREENKLSQREFARRCALSHSLISLIELGTNPQTGKSMSQDMDTYKKLADGMGISVQRLFEKLGNDATVKLISNESEFIVHEPYTKFNSPKSYRLKVKDNTSVFGMALAKIATKTPRKASVIKFGDEKIDKQFESVKQLWKVSSPKDREDTIKFMEFLNTTKR